jgi:hypothetical protein
MLDGRHHETVPSPTTMTRAIASLLLLGAVLFAAAPGCSDEGIGDPCTPEQEYDPAFNGFDEKEVNVESKSFQCRTRICLVNHFRGRVSCPYGQGSDRSAPPGATGCTVPGRDEPITGLKSKDADPNNNDSYVDPRKKAAVPAQCIDRSADRAVYCSCRCADINGQTPSNQNFCECPDGYTCEKLVTSIGGGISEGLTGSYCIKNTTKYDPAAGCTQGDRTPESDKTAQK